MTLDATTLQDIDWERAQIVLATIVLGAIPLFVFREGSTWVSRLFIMMLVFALLATGLNIVFGHTDQLYLFLGGLTGISAYGTMIVATELGIDPMMAWIPLALFVGGIGFVVSYVAARRRLTIILIAVVTLALQLAIVEVFLGARQWTGGSVGLRYTGFELEFLQTALGLSFHQSLYYFLFVIFIAVLVGYYWLRNSKLGLAFEMIRQDELAAESIGINVVRYKALAGFMGAFVVGLVGPFYGQLEGLILPNMFSFVAIDVLVLIMLIIGGLRTMLGPVIGAGAMIYINEIVLHGAGQWRLVAYGGVLIVLFLYFRQGIIPFLSTHLRTIPARIGRQVNDREQT